MVQSIHTRVQDYMIVVTILLPGYITRPYRLIKIEGSGKTLLKTSRILMGPMYKVSISLMSLHSWENDRNAIKEAENHHISSTD